METPKPPYEHAWWCVCVLDLLGQQDAFLKTDHMPDRNDDSARQALIEELKASLGVVREFRLLASSFGLTLDTHPVAPDSPLLTLPEPLREQAQKLKRTRVKELHWSDGLIFYACLTPRDDHTPAIAVQQMLLCAASLLLLQLARGRPIRGGIDVGTGIESEGQLFGAGLVKAYQLESKVAQYPRIVVGDTLVQYLSQLVQPPHPHAQAQLSAAVAQTTDGLLCRDDDGRLIVDYLGETARGVFADTTPQLGPLVHQAHRFVIESRTRWREQQDEKLFNRYSKLARYFDRRIHLWPG